MKSKLLALISLVGLAISANAATVNLVRSGAGTGIQAQTSTGANLSAGGYYIAVGTYAVIPTITDTDSFVSAVNNFSVFGSFLSPITGTTLGLIVGGVTATDTAFNSAQLFVLVGNGSTKANSTEFAILQGTPAFTFAANLGVAGATSYTLANAGNFQPLLGAGTEIDNATGADGVQLRSIVAVPEPSTALLGLLGIAGLIRRRR